MLRIEVCHEPCPRWLLSGTDLWNSRAMDQALLPLYCLYYNIALALFHFVKGHVPNVTTIHQAEHPGLAVAGWNAAGTATLLWLSEETKSKPRC